MSPIRIRKLPNSNKYRVYDGDRIAAKNTTRTKALKQAKLLRAVAHGFKPTGRK